MKKSLLIFVVGLLCGGAGWHYYQRAFHPTVAQRTGEMAARTREATAETKQQAADKARALGEDLSDAGIVARIKGKYLVERDISSLAISVECTDGHVTLTGSASSDQLVTRAEEIARQTKGVTAVTTRLTVK